MVNSYNLINLLDAMGKQDEAVAMCQAELEKCWTVLGEDHQDTQDFLEQLDGLNSIDVRRVDMV